MTFELYTKYIRALRVYPFILVLVISSLCLLPFQFLYNVSWALTLTKYMEIISVWFSVLLFPYHRLSLKQYAGLDNFLICLLFLLVFISIVRVPFNESLRQMDDIYGDWFLSWLFNPYSMSAFYPIAFMILTDKKRFWMVFKYVFVVLSISNSLYSFVWNYGSSFILYYLPLFKTHLLRYKIMYFIIWFVLFMKGMDIWGVMRIHMIFFVLVLAIFIVYHWLHNLLLQRLLAVFLVISPLYYVTDAVINGESVFQKMGNYSKDETLTEDTRTFLYNECVADLVANESVLFGKGCHSFYYSEYFEKTRGVSGRNAVEVPILNFWLKTGLLFCITMLLLMLRCIYLCLYDSKNSISKCVGLIIAGLFLILFVGDINGVGIFQMLMWFLIGCGLSKPFRYASEQEIKAIVA